MHRGCTPHGSHSKTTNQLKQNQQIGRSGRSPTIDPKLSCNQKDARTHPTRHSRHLRPKTLFPWVPPYLSLMDNRFRDDAIPIQFIRVHSRPKTPFPRVPPYLSLMEIDPAMMPSQFSFIRVHLRPKTLFPRVPLYLSLMDIALHEMGVRHVTSVEGYCAAEATRPLLQSRHLWLPTK